MVSTLLSPVLSCEQIPEKKKDSRAQLAPWGPRLAAAREQGSALEKLRSPGLFLAVLHSHQVKAVKG